MGLVEDLDPIQGDLGKIAIPHATRGLMIFIHTSALIDLWIEWYYSNNKNRDLIKRSDVRNKIIAVPGCISMKSVKRIGGKVYRCCVFNSKKMPNSLKKIIKLREE